MPRSTAVAVMSPPGAVELRAGPSSATNNLPASSAQPPPRNEEVEEPVPRSSTSSASAAAAAGDADLATAATTATTPPANGEDLRAPTADETGGHSGEEGGEEEEAEESNAPVSGARRRSCEARVPPTSADLEAAPAQESPDPHPVPSGPAVAPGVTVMTAPPVGDLVAAAGADPLDWQTLVGALQTAPARVAELVLPEEHAHAGRGLLHLAALRDKPAYAALLVARGANPRMQDANGETPLHVAARHGNEHVVKVILDVEPEAINALDVDRWTPLHSAAEQGHEPVVALLMRAGANINARCKQGGTPLFLAAMEGHVIIVDMLLRAGARNFKAYFRDTPADMAEKNGHCDLASCLHTFFASADDYMAQPDLFEPHELIDSDGEDEDEYDDAAAL